MREIGYALIAIGFLGGALVSVLDPEAMPWLAFLPFLGLGGLGVVFAQLALRREASQGGKIEANLDLLAASLARITESSRRLEDEKSGLDVYDLTNVIDELFREDVSEFVDVRDAMSYAWGAQAYGDIMSHFAAGERYVNRVWSAAADGYIDEAHAYIEFAREQFEEALRKFESARSAAA